MLQNRIFENYKNNKSDHIQTLPPNFPYDPENAVKSLTQASI